MKKQILIRDCHQQSSCGAHVDAALPPGQHRAGWPAGMSVMAPLSSPRAPLTHASGDSAASVQLAHGSSQKSTTLLVPKTEKLSPVQLYTTDWSSLTGTRLRLLWTGENDRVVLCDKTSRQTTLQSVSQSGDVVIKAAADRQRFKG